MILLLVTVIVIILLLLVEKKKKYVFVDETEPLNRSIGNFMSDLFFQIGNSWSKGETYTWKDKDKARNEFYKNLPEVYPVPKGANIPSYTSHEDDAPSVSAWTVDTDEGKKFWNAMKPYIHDILDEAFIKSGLRIYQSNPIIHFRCSDVPFNRQPWYHLAKYNFYKKALDGYSKVDIMSCNTHISSSKEQEMCKKFADLLSKELEPVKVNLVCGNYIEDFAKMFYAPLVVSPGSSMSFMAGYFGHGKLITTGHFKEGTASECKVCEGDKSDVLLHADVPDYYNVDEVNKMLKDDK